MVHMYSRFLGQIFIGVPSKYKSGERDLGRKGTHRRRPNKDREIPYIVLKNRKKRSMKP